MRIREGVTAEGRRGRGGLEKKTEFPDSRLDDPAYPTLYGKKKKGGKREKGKS